MLLQILQSTYIVFHIDDVCFCCELELAVNSENTAYLIEINHESAEAYGYRLTTLHTCENTIHQTDLCLLSWYI